MNKVPDEKRMAVLYQKLCGRAYRKGDWDAKLRDEVQQILYVEDACQSILEVIDQMRSLDHKDDDGPSASDLIDEMKGEVHFLKTLINDKRFLSSLRFLQT